MDKQQVREKAAAFLDEIREGVAKILQDPNKGFDFGTYISKWDGTHNCGTVCCMEGWIPAIRPDLAIWEDGLVYPIKHRIDTFRPGHVGIPISYGLWFGITVWGEPMYPMRENATFKEVSEVWGIVAADIRSGELDEYLLFDLN